MGEDNEHDGVTHAARGGTGLTPEMMWRGLSAFSVDYQKIDVGWKGVGSCVLKEEKGRKSAAPRNIWREQDRNSCLDGENHPR
jgi:hypothetical protein